MLSTGVQQLSNDPTLSSLPLLSTFLKAYARPYLGLVPPSLKQSQTSSEHDPVSPIDASTESNRNSPTLLKEEDELVERDIRDRFKRMCEGYFDTVCKKLVIEHKVSGWVNISPRMSDLLRNLQRLQEQDRRNHEAYIRSGQIFEDRQQAYEKMTKGYEKLLSSCQK